MREPSLDGKPVQAARLLLTGVMVSLFFSPQVTVLPSPMSQTIRLTSPTAVTVTPPADADSLVGPVVCSPGWVHIHTGSPTKPPVDLGGGAMPICGACITIEAIACSAKVRGSIGGPGGGSAPLGRKMRATQSRENPGGGGQTISQTVPFSRVCPAQTGSNGAGCGSAIA